MAIESATAVYQRLARLYASLASLATTRRRRVGHCLRFHVQRVRGLDQLSVRRWPQRSALSQKLLDEWAQRETGRRPESSRGHPIGERMAGPLYRTVSGIDFVLLLDC